MGKNTIHCDYCSAELVGDNLNVMSERNVRTKESRFIIMCEKCYCVQDKKKVIVEDGVKQVYVWEGSLLEISDIDC